MQQMKDSVIAWIGEIPTTWSTIVCKSIVLSNCAGIWGDEPTEGGANKIVIRSTEQTVDGLWRIENPAIRDLSKIDYSSYKICPNDLLITKSSGSSLHIGKTTIANGWFKMHESYYSNFIQRIRVNEQAYLPRLLWYILNSNIAREQFVYLQNSTSGIGNINAKDIDSIIIPFCSILVQHKIVDYLDAKCVKIDNLIAHEEAAIEELKSYKQSVITKAVTKGLNKSVLMKDSGIEWIDEIPTHWYPCKLSDVCKVITDFVASGSFADIKSNVKYLDEPDYAMLVRTTDLSGSNRSEKRVYINEHAYRYLSNSNLFGGEIVLPNIGASCGDVYIVPTLYARMSLAPNSIMLKTKYNDKYYFYFFQSKCGRELLLNLCASTAQQKFNKTELRVLRVPLLPLDEQNAIVSYLDKKCADIDNLISIKQHKIEELKEYKKSLIYEYVTGKKEVC